MGSFRQIPMFFQRIPPLLCEVCSAFAPQGESPTAVLMQKPSRAISSAFLVNLAHNEAQLAMEASVARICPGKLGSITLANG